MIEREAIDNLQYVPYDETFILKITNSKKKCISTRSIAKVFPQDFMKINQKFILM